MNTVPDTGRAGAATPLDFDRFRLRKFMQDIAAEGEVEVIEQKTDLADVAAIVANTTKAVWFKKVGPEEQELVASVAGWRSRLAKAFGVSERQLLGELMRRLDTKHPVVEVTRAQAPCQQMVLTGDDVDVTSLPVHLQHGLDGAPYISSAIDFSIDPKTGWTNVGLRRLMLRSRTETGVDLNAPSDLRIIYMEAAAAGKPVPVAYVIGSHPVDMIAATMSIPVDELSLMASLRDAPMPVVKCITNDLRVPADAEYVIEGWLDPHGYVEPEGPYGEYMGYYGGVKKNPVFHVTAITRRSDALFQTISISGKHLARTDTSQLENLRTELNVWRALKLAVREPLAVYAPVAAAGAQNVRVQLRQRVPGEARSAIMAVLGACGVKNMFVVDPDIDIFNDEEMEWALGTRFQPAKDLIIVDNVRMSPLDPSLDGARTGSKAGYDLTWPFGKGGMDTIIPAAPAYAGKRFASLEAALADGPKYFEDLMAAVGSRDGREIVRELDGLKAKGKAGRDAQGRWTNGT
ncbi:MAG: carboxylyase [Rhizobiales bacterium 62-17]|nr:UbiD family decarboxylase [Hyphomicrobiales bacterium]OJY03191.1 MAG: carboxylyase [Rhizobiales bacterium 62-17]